MNYIVSWIIIKFVIGSCPSITKPNEFGVTPNSYMSCAALHINEDKTQNKKEFENKKEALLFLKKINEYSKFQEQQAVSSLGKIKIAEIKLDSVTINK